MWLCCKSGFFSGVRHAEKPDTIHVRARFKGDLERLCKAHGVKPDVAVTPRNDYGWRMDFPVAEWARIVKEEAEGINYTNFKDAVHDGTERDDAYLNAWAAMREAQERGGRRGASHKVRVLQRRSS